MRVAIGGFQHDHFRWEAIGGTANYGDLPPGALISYQQTWGTGYLGGSLGYTSGPWSFVGRLVGSPWANSYNRDLHHARSTLFTDAVKNTSYASGEMGIAYRFNQQFSMTADYRFQQWGLGKGISNARDLVSGDTANFGENSAGAGNTSHTLSLGFKVDLQPMADRPANNGGASPLWCPWWSQTPHSRGENSVEHGWHESRYVSASLRSFSIICSWAIWSRISDCLWRNSAWTRAVASGAERAD